VSAETRLGRPPAGASSTPSTGGSPSAGSSSAAPAGRNPWPT